MKSGEVHQSSIQSQLALQSFLSTPTSPSINFRLCRMSRPVRIILIILLAVSTALFGYQFKSRYDRASANQTTVADSDLANPNANLTPDDTEEATPKQNESLGVWIGGLVVSILGLAGLAALEVGHYFGIRAGRAYFDETQTGPDDPDYEAAEDACNRGDFVEAIELLREYFKANPTKVHAAIRIAEIYEKELHTPLAAALEYEQVLTHKLPRERWGWLAIHLCNLYSGPLHQSQKAIDLLLRIESEYHDTKAGKKARARLEQLVDEGIIPPLPEHKAEESDSPEETETEQDREPEAETSEPALPEPPPQHLPPGFRPRS
jgi:tetratricopeptide (TPR) repeat protein